MVTTVTKSATVVPLPPVIVGQAKDDKGIPITDESGNPFIGNRGDAILDAIYALAQELRHVSSSISQLVEAATAQLIANHTEVVADLATKSAQLTSIQTLVQQILQNPGNNLTQADADALTAAVAGNTADTTALHTEAQTIEQIVTTTATSS